MEALEKSFDAYLLVKSATEKDGKKYLNGPAALVEEDGRGSDFDGDDLVQKAVEGGLETFMRLGGQVDWDHLYAKSHNPKHIIAKSVGVTPNPDGKGAPVVSVELFMQKELAKAAWEHHECGGILGFSLQGIAKARDPKNSKRITALDIHMMTITPMPKGYEGPRLTEGNASLGAIIKGMNAQLEAGDTEDWDSIEDIELVEKATDLTEKDKPEERLSPRYKGSCEKCGTPLKDSLCAVCGTDNPANFRGGAETVEKAAAEPCKLCFSGQRSNPNNEYVGVSPKEIPAGHHYFMHEGKAYCSTHMSGTSAFGSFEPHEKYGLPDQSFKMKLKKGVEKALETGSGIVQAGDTGGSTLRQQDLLNTLRKRRKKKGAKGERHTPPLNEALSLAVAAHGASNAAALTKAILSKM